MSSRGDKEFLQDILEACRRISFYIEGIDYEEFLEDIKTQDSVLRNIEIIGEAVKNISDNIKNNYPEIEWKEIAKMRDKIIHLYFGVNFDIVWDVIKNKLPDLKEKISSILEDMEKDEEMEIGD